MQSAGQGDAVAFAAQGDFLTGKGRPTRSSTSCGQMTLRMVMWLIQLHSAHRVKNGNVTGKRSRKRTVGKRLVLHHQPSLGPKGLTTPMLCHKLRGRSKI